MSALWPQGWGRWWSEQGRAAEWTIPENSLPVLSAAEISKAWARDCLPFG